MQVVVVVVSEVEPAERSTGGGQPSEGQKDPEEDRQSDSAKHSHDERGNQQEDSTARHTQGK